MGVDDTRWFVLRDAVWGDVWLTRAEGRLLDSREMQRLRGVRQLGLAHLVYPGARHSRFEHSVGTLHMAQTLVDAVARNADRFPSECVSVSADETRVLRAAALVHDVTHVPYGHNIEDQCGMLPRHDTPERFLRMFGEDSELGGELRRQGLLDRVLCVLGAVEGGEPPFLRQMISDTICSDLMDYLARDARFTGMKLGYDARIADYFRIDADSRRLYVDCAKEGLVREDVVSEVLRMLQARYYFSERVYYHHAKIAAGAMIARAVETSLAREWLTPDELYGQTDEGLLATLTARTSGLDDADARVCAGLVDRLARRRLYKRVAVFPYAGNREVQEDLVARFFDSQAATARRNWEQEREAEVREHFGIDVQVLFYCPSRRMQLKEVDTLVRFPGERDLQPLSSFRDRLPRIADLEESYLRLWKAYVLTSTADRDVRAFLQERVRAALPTANDAYSLT